MADLLTDGSAADVQAKIDAAVLGADTVVVPDGQFSWASGVTFSGVRIRGGGSGRIIARSISSVVVGTGAKTFTTQIGLSITAGQILRIAGTGARTNYMEGTVTSYGGTTLVMNITSTGGSGTRHEWIISTPPTTVITHNSAGALFSITEDATHHTELSGIKIVLGTGTGDAVSISTDGKSALLHDLWFEYASGISDHCIRSSTNHAVVWDCSFDSSPFSLAALAVAVKNDSATDAWTNLSYMGAADTGGSHNFYFEDCDFHAWLNATDFDGNSRAVMRHCLFNNAAVGTHGADTGPVGMRHFEVYDSEFTFTGHDDGTTFPLSWWFFIRGGTGVITDNILPAIESTDYPAKDEITLIVLNLRRGSGPNPCWGADIPGIQYPCPRQVGMGRVTGVAGNDDITYIGDSEPLYIWNNTGTYNVSVVDDNTFPGQCTNPDSSVDYVVADRDYFNDGTAKPGYTKFTYPHPLRSEAAPETPPMPHNPGSHRTKWQLLFEWSRLVGGNPKPSNNELKLLRQIYLAL